MMNQWQQATYSICPVHQRDTIHSSEREDEAPVDSADNFLLLLGREGVDVGVVDGFRVVRDGALEVLDMAVLLRIVIDDGGRHGCGGFLLSSESREEVLMTFGVDNGGLDGR